MVKLMTAIGLERVGRNFVVEHIFKDFIRFNILLLILCHSFMQDHHKTNKGHVDQSSSIASVSARSNVDKLNFLQNFWKNQLCKKNFVRSSVLFDNLSPESK